MTDRLTLTNLQLLIRDSIVLGLPGTVWVTAEILELRENFSGHCYLELVEKDPVTEIIRAKVKATIWAARYRMLKPAFEEAAGIRLAAGLNVLLKVTVEYHELYGLSLNITDIDPAFTLGGMALARNAIIRRLKTDGVFEMNRELGFPALPQRIAVVSSESSAGYTDFIRQLNGNRYGFSFTAKLFSSPMQGEETEKGVLAALDQIAGRAGKFDVVVILRGGGSSSDLRWFDNYLIAYHVTQFPIPVITGIGHDKDVSVTDMVAWKSLKTPTAAAEYLIEKMVETDARISEFDSSLRQLVSEYLRESGSLVMQNARRVMPVTGGIIADARRSAGSITLRLSSAASSKMRQTMVKAALLEKGLRNTTASLVASVISDLGKKREICSRNASSIIGYHAEKLAKWKSLTQMANPVNILRRGFTITEIDGKPVKNSAELKPGDIIITRFRDGQIGSEVKRCSNRKHHDQKRDEIQ